jgi:hypothetical protein
MIFDRMKGKHAILRAACAPSVADTNAGEYHGLYTYLRDRYANRIVLTFGEIEDLLGFSLPQPARVEMAWWGGAAAAGLRSSQTNAWTLAGRSAVVNLLAQTVVFERAAV